MKQFIKPLLTVLLHVILILIVDIPKHIPIEVKLLVSIWIGMYSLILLTAIVIDYIQFKKENKLIHS
jgi:preprotein translocase subunit SecF